MTKVRHQVVPRTMSFVFNNNRVLLLKAKHNKEWDGTYDPLGGHIEKGENIIKAANREIWEESGLKPLDTTLKGIVHVNGFFNKEIMLFVTSSTTNDENVVSNHEGELEWVELDKLENIKTFEDLKPILNHMLQMKPGELFIGTSKWDGKDGLLAIDIKSNQLSL